MGIRRVILNALLDGATNLPNLTGTKNVDDPSQPAQPSMITALVRENLEKDKDAVDETKNAFARRKSGAYEKLAGSADLSLSMIRHDQHLRHDQPQSAL
eukprot:1148164-Pelagomonas_calceolata.AAC.2